MSVTLHTTLGALKLELYCADAPKSCENFLALCASEVVELGVETIAPCVAVEGDPSITVEITAPPPGGAARSPGGSNARAARAESRGEATYEL